MPFWTSVWPIAQRLYLGDYDSGCAALSGVEHPTEPEGELRPFAGVVSLCPVPLLPDHEVARPMRGDTEWLQIPILDGGNGEEEFESALAVALPFIRRRRQRGNVLIHCAAGMSRSVSVLAAYLCEHEGASVDEAFGLVADAKARAVGQTGIIADLLIAPAWEFQTALRRRYAGRPRPTLRDK